MTHPTEPQTELHLPDEDRARLLEAPGMGCFCGHKAVLMERVNPESRRKEYQVKCSFERFVKPTTVMNYYELNMTHIEPTPWRASSAEAIQIWRLTRALAKL
jgi:hypothetical protein